MLHSLIDRAYRSAKDGFTIVELSVVLMVSGILMVIIFTLLDGFYGSHIAITRQALQATETRSVLRTMASEISNSPGFLTSLTASNPTGMNNDGTTWSYQTNDSTNSSNRRVLIAAVYGTDKSTNDSTRQLLFVDSGGTCNTTTGTPFRNYFVYFVAPDPLSGDINNLYRRTMIGNGTPCPQPLFQRQSCGAVAARSYPALCPSTDAVLLRDVTSFSVDYYTLAGDQTPIPDQYGSGASSVPAAKAVNLTVVTKQRISGSDQLYSSNIRIGRIN